MSGKDVTERSSPKRLATRKTFEDLPPRTIIFDILAYHPKNPYEESKNASSTDSTKMLTEEEEWTGYAHNYDSIEENFSLFGRYRRDRRRNIWFFFTSIDLSDSDYKPSCVRSVHICFPKMEYIKFRTNNKYIFDRLFKECSGMYRLHTLNSVGSSEERFCRLLSSKGCFPKLKSLSISSRISCDISITEGEEILKRISTTLKNLKYLEIVYSFGKKNFIMQALERSNSFPLSNLSVSTCMLVGQPVSLEVPHLTRLVFLESKNINVVSGNHLKYILFDFLACDFVKKSLQNAINLQELSYQGKNQNIPNWFLDKSFNPLKKLRKISLSSIRFTKKLENDFKRLSHQFDEVKIIDCRNYEKSIFSLPSPSTLCLEETLIPDFGYPFINLDSSSHIRRFSVKFREIGDELFRKYDWPKLEELLIWSRQTLEYTRWNQLDKLKYLNLFGHLSADLDIFFRNQNFYSLETLIMDDVAATGVGWKGTFDSRKFGNLKKILFRDCGYIQDELFQENEFPALEYVFFAWWSGVGNTVGKSSVRLTGNGWKLSNCDVLCNIENFGFGEKTIEELKERNVKFVETKNKNCSYFMGMINNSF